MNTELNNTLQKTFLELPQELRDLLVSKNFADTLSVITEGHPLQEHQTIAAENEVVLIMLGLESPRGLVTNIRHRAQISRDRAEKIVKTVNEKILIPHKEIFEAAFLNRDNEPGQGVVGNMVTPAEVASPSKDEQVVSGEEMKKKPTHEYAVDPYREPI